MRINSCSYICLYLLVTPSWSYRPHSSLKGYMLISHTQTCGYIHGLHHILFYVLISHISHGHPKPQTLNLNRELSKLYKLVPDVRVSVSPRYRRMEFFALASLLQAYGSS